MAELNSSSSTTTNFKGTVPDFIVKSMALDAATQNLDESYWYFTRATLFYGYYNTIPEIFSAANALSTWTVSRGWKAKDGYLVVSLVANDAESILLKAFQKALRNTSEEAPF